MTFNMKENKKMEKSMTILSIVEPLKALLVSNTI